MGTYIRVKLLDSSKAAEANELISAITDIPQEEYCGVKYGLFVTDEMVDEDLRFVNNDPEGLQQMPSMERPISREALISMKFGNGAWGGIGQWCIKTKLTPQEMGEVIAMIKFKALHGDKYIDYNSSENIHLMEVNERSI